MTNLLTSWDPPPSWISSTFLCHFHQMKAISLHNFHFSTLLYKQLQMHLRNFSSAQFKILITSLTSSDFRTNLQFIIINLKMATTFIYWKHLLISIFFCFFRFPCGTSPSENQNGNHNHNQDQQGTAQCDQYIGEKWTYCLVWTTRPELTFISWPWVGLHTFGSWNSRWIGINILCLSQHGVKWNFVGIVNAPHPVISGDCTVLITARSLTKSVSYLKVKFVTWDFHRRNWWADTDAPVKLLKKF